MKMFITEGGMGRYAIRAETARSATAWARRRHGTGAGEIRSRAASQDDLADQIDGGAVFWDASTGDVVPKAEAFALAGRAA